MTWTGLYDARALTHKSASDHLIPRSSKISVPLDDYQPMFSTRPLEIKREIPRCRDTLFRSGYSTSTFEKRLPAGDVREIEIYMSEPYNRNFTVTINMNYALHHLLEKIRAHMDSIPLLPGLVVHDMKFKYAGEQIPVDAKLKDVFTIPTHQRLDAVFDFTKSREQKNEKLNFQLKPEHVPKSSSNKLKTEPSLIILARM